MLNHEEIRAIITALGVGVYPTVDITKLRYGKVVIMTDADVDGSHIRTLLLTFFFRQMAEVIQDGRLFIAQPPLYKIGITQAQTQYVYSEEEKTRVVSRAALKDLSIHDPDGGTVMTTTELQDKWPQVKDFVESKRWLLDSGLPTAAFEFLVKLEWNQSFESYNDATSFQAMLNRLGYISNLRSDPKNGDYFVEVEDKESKTTGSIILEDRFIQSEHLKRVLKIFPALPKLTRSKNGKYVVAKKGKSLSTALSWNEALDTLEQHANNAGLSLQRYKGLGEMNPDQLWETTMNPSTRTLLRVNIEDAALADEVFISLMGDEVLPRRLFIQAHATQVKNLDV